MFDEFLAELHLTRAQAAVAGATTALVAGVFLFGYVAPRLGRGLLAAGTWAAGRLRHEPSPLAKLLLERLAHPDWKLETTKSDTCVLKGCEGATYASCKDGLTRVWLSGCDDPASVSLIPSSADRAAVHRAVTALYERLKMEQALQAVAASAPGLPQPERPQLTAAGVKVSGTPGAPPAATSSAAAPYDVDRILSHLHHFSCGEDTVRPSYFGGDRDHWVVWLLNPLTYRLTLVCTAVSLDLARRAVDALPPCGATYLLAQIRHLPQTEEFNRRNVAVVVH